MNFLMGLCLGLEIRIHGSEGGKGVGGRQIGDRSKIIMHWKFGWDYTALRTVRDFFRF
jgi:hypothetical protein